MFLHLPDLLAGIHVYMVLQIHRKTISALILECVVLGIRVVAILSRRVGSIIATLVVEFIDDHFKAVYDRCEGLIESMGKSERIQGS